ncbi:lysophospholipid acyltransferase family protein [Stutzerimonas nitrititolerans]|uniref:lysophospholipid acyltransferase family protein n=1 Tax=Stutzerimonas nitrititolerans TaxID=2482751 RepID=UPI00289B88FC|nr:lysophospholipid acyltransferase family protein [Stutzerimonas nitrititolerans]
MRRLRQGLRLVRFFAALGGGVLLAGLVSVAESLARRELQALRQRLSQRFMGRLAAALPFRLELSGQLPEQPMLWVANHVSWTDIPLLGQLAPLSFLAKAEVRQWPLAGWLAQCAGTLFIRRGAGDGLLLARRIAERLGGGCPLLVFPEGTSSDGRLVLPFHGRLLAGAIEAGVPLQPVALRYMRDGLVDPLAPFIGEDELPTHLLRLFAADHAVLRIQLLEPIASVGGQRSTLARQARAAIEVALGDEPQTDRQAA